MTPKPLIKKENGQWVAWMPVQDAHCAIKSTFPTWGQALQAVGIWHKAQRTDAIALRLTRKFRRAMVASKATNYINHIALVIDESGSMQHLTREVVKVVDAQVAYLAQRSTEMDQETRITFYTFAETPRCTRYDTDVLRAPSLEGNYHPGGGTALIDATLQALDDAALISEKYGDHAHLLYVFTDGEENLSGWDAAGRPPTWNWKTPPHLIEKLRNRLGNLPPNVTVACMVPGANGVFEAKRFGFHPGNVSVWDATSAKGMREAGEVMRATTDSYMQARATGVRSTTSLFDIGANVVNAKTILDAGLTPLDYDEYDLVPIGVWPGQVKPADYDEKKRRKPWKAHGGRIDEFVMRVRGGQYIVGQAYYQLTAGKVEKIQASKNIAVVDKNTDRVYTGKGARQLLKLPDNMEVRIKPSDTDEYLVFVQSKSPNRLLVPGAKLLIFKK